MALSIKRLIEDEELREKLTFNLSKNDWSHFELVTLFKEIIYDEVE